MALPSSVHKRTSIQIIYISVETPDPFFIKSTSTFVYLSSMNGRKMKKYDFGFCLLRGPVPKYKHNSMNNIECDRDLGHGAQGSPICFVWGPLPYRKPKSRGTPIDVLVL